MRRPSTNWRVVGSHADFSNARSASLADGKAKGSWNSGTKMSNRAGGPNRKPRRGASGVFGSAYGGCGHRSPSQSSNNDRETSFQNILRGTLPVWRFQRTPRSSSVTVSARAATPGEAAFRRPSDSRVELRLSYASRGGCLLGGAFEFRPCFLSGALEFRPCFPKRTFRRLFGLR